MATTKLDLESMRAALRQEESFQASRRQVEEAEPEGAAAGEAIMDKCRRKFAQANDRVPAWLSDVETHRKAAHCASSAMYAAAHTLQQAGCEVVHHIEQGPAGMRVLAFGGCVASLAISITSLLNYFSAMGHPIVYVVSMYQGFFAFTAGLFEMKPEWVTDFEHKSGVPLETYQLTLAENCKFLTLSGGRGLFYIFLGSLGFVLAGSKNYATFACASYLFFVGSLHILMGFGIGLETVVAKMRLGYHDLNAASCQEHAEP
eukprot:TRINITY_DN19720_c0_g1_i5.p1 TRINITY_DN19720_c0_g1~~TRINITY_DN19720_c0_g1_i5.p1  ORF type:complete len:260 (-),score=14.65 TRINITY_DN19720_c0_g1_i5:445-1224(-)